MDLICRMYHIDYIIFGLTCPHEEVWPGNQKKIWGLKNHSSVECVYSEEKVSLSKVVWQESGQPSVTQPMAKAYPMYHF